MVFSSTKRTLSLAVLRHGSKTMNDASTIVAIVGLALSIVTMIVYVSVRFARIESEVERFKAHQDDLKDMRDIVYEIRSQNKVILALAKIEIPS